MNGVLHQLQVMISAVGNKNQQHDANTAEMITSKLAELRDIMEQSTDSASSIIDTLKNSSSNPGSSYYWLIFVFLYGGVYFFQ